MMRHKAKRAAVSGLILVSSLAAGCADEGADPIPQISGLSCELEADADGSVYTGIFSFDYLDGDGDLHDDGGAVLWWVDEVAQQQLSLSSSQLGKSGTLTLSLDGFPAYEVLSSRFQVIDAAGNVSNELTAELVTDPNNLSCAAVE